MRSFSRLLVAATALSLTAGPSCRKQRTPEANQPDRTARVREARSEPRPPRTESWSALVEKLNGRLERAVRGADRIAETGRKLAGPAPGELAALLEALLRGGPPHGWEQYLLAVARFLDEYRAVYGRPVDIERLRSLTIRYNTVARANNTARLGAVPEDLPALPTQPVDPRTFRHLLGRIRARFDEVVAEYQREVAATGAGPNVRRVAAYLLGRQAARLRARLHGLRCLANRRCDEAAARQLRQALAKVVRLAETGDAAAMESVLRTMRSQPRGG